MFDLLLPNPEGDPSGAPDAAQRNAAGACQVHPLARFRTRSLFLLPPDDERARRAAHLGDVERVTQRLRAAGANVSILDRQTGKWFGRASKRRAA